MDWIIKTRKRDYLSDLEDVICTLTLFTGFFIVGEQQPGENKTGQQFDQKKKGLNVNVSRKLHWLSHHVTKKLNKNVPLWVLIQTFDLSPLGGDHLLVNKHFRIYKRFIFEFTITSGNIVIMTAKGSSKSLSHQPEELWNSKKPQKNAEGFIGFNLTERSQVGFLASVLFDNIWRLQITD